MNTVPTVTLNNGVTMPQLGLGVWRINDDQTTAIVAEALRCGYRSIDTATMYGNEAGVGRAIAESGIPREEVFITTKLWNDAHGYDNTLRAFDESLQRLGTDYLDLYLIHWPQQELGLYGETWSAMQHLYDDKRVRTIGVSNFEPAHLDRIGAEGDVVPTVNQIELHPYMAQQELRGYHASHGIASEAWRPLGRGSDLLDNPTVTGIAARHDKTPAQTVLRWHIQHGHIVIPKTATPQRLPENIDIFDFALTNEEVHQIDQLNTDRRLGPAPDA